MRILFMGTPEFAKRSLMALVEAGEDVCAVISQPDKPKGRGMNLAAPPVKEYALSKGIEVYQPQSLKDGQAAKILEKCAPELIIVVAYGKILPEYILNYPKYGCINVHASLLPKYRGASPIQWSIINGEKETGITTMYMDKGLDTGDIILSDKLAIGDDETAGELHDRLAELGAKLLIKTVELIKTGSAPRIKQDDSKASYAPMLTKAMGEIDWTKPAGQIKNLIRGLLPWPRAYSFLDGRQFKICSSEIVKGSGGAGEVICASKSGGLVVACGEDALRLKEIQFEGCKKMTDTQYLIGHNVKPGTVLGR